ncbi:hypothetical protein ACGFIV_32390 [Sphaerisporangium sp. NPDC049003]|uniref:hypothetical protein n=1 Tax=Sphaerisporangium sp. NPDC049003 TaxID=3364517 RepID=UPI00371A2B0F
MATTDVHSALDHAVPLLTHLHHTRPRSLIVDSGDFFEGPHYQLTRGRVERDILTELYDVIAPGNHGWTHHFDPALRRITVCANTIDRSTAAPLFRPLHHARISGRRVAITAVIGEGAFASIAPDLRAHHDVISPISALQRLHRAHRHEADSWILLSHSGFAHDIDLARECPFLDLVFSGHCHSSRNGPTRVAGGTIVVKGREHGAGYATAELQPSGWTARSRIMPQAATAPAQLNALTTQIAKIDQQLDESIGPLRERWRNTSPDPGEVLARTATAIRDRTGAGVVLNHSALRQRHLQTTLTRRQLADLAPYDNRLLYVDVQAHHLVNLLIEIAAQTGPLAVSLHDRPSGRLLTTDYLAPYLADSAHSADLRLSHIIGAILTTSAPWTAMGSMD